MSHLFHCLYCWIGGATAGFCAAIVLSALVSYALGWVCGLDPREGAGE